VHQRPLKGKKTDPGVTNIRNVKSPHWRRMAAVAYRHCHQPTRRLQSKLHRLARAAYKQILNSTEYRFR